MGATAEAPDRGRQAAAVIDTTVNRTLIPPGTGGGLQSVECILLRGHATGAQGFLGSKPLRCWAACLTTGFAFGAFMARSYDAAASSFLPAFA